jgi:hypothetical protein
MVAAGPGLALGGPSGGRPCWDPFWCGRAMAAADPAQGVGVPPQSPSSSGPMGILNACLRPSAQKAFHLFDQCLGSIAPGPAIQAEFVGFVVVSVLHSEGGEGLQWQKVLDLNSGLLQQQQQSGDVVR